MGHNLSSIEVILASLHEIKLLEFNTNKLKLRPG